MNLVELQHRLKEAQQQDDDDDRKVKLYTAASSQNSCQKAKLEALSKLGAREPELDEDEKEAFDECMLEQREKGESSIRARRLCTEMIIEQREASSTTSTKIKGSSAARRKFLGTGILPKINPGVFTILQR
jgi:hypothetical protein